MTVERAFLVKSSSFNRADKGRMLDWADTPMFAADPVAYEGADDRSISQRTLVLSRRSASGEVTVLNHFKYRLVIGGCIWRDDHSHIIPLLCRFMQDKISGSFADSHDAIGTMSSYFSSFTKHSSDNVVGIKRRGVAYVVEKVRRQLEWGLPLFDKEAMLSHISAYLGEVVSYEDGNVFIAEHNLAVDALMDISIGNHVNATIKIELMGSLSDETSSSKMLSRGEHGALSLFRSYTLVDSLYRQAACETSGEKRCDTLETAKIILEGAERFLGHYIEDFGLGLGDPVMIHYAKLRSLVETGIDNTDSSGSCGSMGTFVEGFGPTSAIISGGLANAGRHVFIAAYRPIGGRIR